MDSTTGSVFSIQRFSIHDGPGIRTTVFLKGCSLRCFWCHNPEGIHLKPEIQFFPERCIGCDECIRACQHGAALLVDGNRVYDRARCVACGACVDTCYAGAHVLTGKTMRVEEVVAEVMRDRAFYDTSNGGVTLSGGEPALQAEFSAAILRRCKAEGMHTAIETAGNVAWESLALVLGGTDLVMMDLKHMDPAKHRWATGVANERLLANARRLAETDRPILFRIPVIPTVNDTAEEVAAVAGYVRELIDLRASNGGAPDAISLELLPFHRLAGDKYRSLGLDYRASDLRPLSKQQMASLAEAASASGVKVMSR